MAEVKFEDNTLKVKAALKEALITFLHEAGGEIEAAAKRNTRVSRIPGSGGHTRDHWKTVVDESKFEAVIGNPDQNAVWEEFGTGKFAAKGNGRKNGWYIPIGNGSSMMSEKVANAYGFKIVHGKDGKLFAFTLGKEPQRMLEKAWKANKEKIKSMADKILGDSMK